MSLRPNTTESLIHRRFPAHMQIKNPFMDLTTQLQKVHVKIWFRTIISETVKD